MLVGIRFVEKTAMVNFWATLYLAYSWCSLCRFCDLTGTHAQT